METEHKDQFMELQKRLLSLHEIQSRFRVIWDSVSDGIIIVDLDGNILEINKGTTRLLGINLEEESEQHNIYFYIASDDHTKVKEVLGKTLNPEKPPMSCHFLTKEGNIFSATIKVNALIDDSETLYNYLIVIKNLDEFRDINETLIESEEQYRTLVESSLDAIAIVQEEGVRYTFVNKALMEMLGYVKNEDIVGHHVAEFIAEDWKDMIVNRAQARLRGENPPSRYEYVMVRKDGKRVNVETRSLRITHQGKPAILGVIRDITERKYAERALRRSEHQLRMLSQRVLKAHEEERARLARELHDQLGQQLVAIELEAISLSRHLVSNSALAPLVNNITILLDELENTVHRITADLRPGILEDNGLVRATQWYVEDFERRTGISCPLYVPTSELAIPPDVAISAYRILQEALTNVAKHAHALRALVKLSTKDEILLLNIEDSGSGMNINRLSPRSTLGLVSMRERARLAGGSLQIRSRPGRGTRITARLPLYPTSNI